MTREFDYRVNPGRVVFGSGTLGRLPEEARELGLERVMVLTTSQQQDQGLQVLQMLGSRGVGLFTGAEMHTPVAVTERAMLAVRDHRADGVLSLGGGSSIGLGKAIAFRSDLPQIAVPTTYAGSEMTPILGETENGSKVTRSSLKVLPESVVYDVDLTLSLPAALSGTSGINAIAHAVEALYARDRNPVVSLMALEGISALVRSLPVIARDPSSRDARSDALYGAWLCGTCLGSVGMSIHHKLCHTIGGSFGLPHAETHTVMLPHALAYNAPVVPEAMAQLTGVLGSRDPVGVLYDLAGEVGAVRGLRDLGMPESAIDEATDRALANPYWNPRPLARASIRNLIANAWAGNRPVLET